MRNVRLIAIIVLLFFIAGGALAVGTTANVLVVQNGNSPTSTSVAAYYVSQRGIPPGNLVTRYPPYFECENGSAARQ